MNREEWANLKKGDRLIVGPNKDSCTEGEFEYEGPDFKGDPYILLRLVKNGVVMGSSWYVDYRYAERKSLVSPSLLVIV